ncbi:ABC transporter permease [Rhodococcus hoagii]|uniref:ABC transporter integral membrane subunit n=1 Tax=Rhodococcus hoagii (strain 103S) TaxID=685727 RepID=A0A3S5YC48_RHOH1|nr:hypothetical protein [Prescottella equi]MBM4557292.1 ABC transporter permease [Prescottella equi]MBM4635642.1 ABC transporter permease [Prescottella equi]MDP8015942.1 ABC transporter permease [Prescottella equi]NKR88287.1 ABC transporter permease [Prescottella equi]NKS07833.1 ABC transporter permease [Prescottella equi]
MNAIETTPPDRARIDTTDHIRAQWEARSVTTETRAKRIRVRRILLVLGSVLAVVGPSILAAAIGVGAGEAFRILLLTVVPITLAFLLLRPR